jgi:hypothetical protein
MKATAIALLCLSLQGCYGFAREYIATHPGGHAVPTDCCCER